MILRDQHLAGLFRSSAQRHPDRDAPVPLHGTGRQFSQLHLEPLEPSVRLRQVDHAVQRKAARSSRDQSPGL